MRISLQAKSLSSSSNPALHNVPLAITIKPANNLPGNFAFEMNSNTLFGLLRQKSDINDFELETFRGALRYSAKSRIPAVTFEDEVLREIGYFID